MARHALAAIGAFALVIPVAACTDSAPQADPGTTASTSAPASTSAAPSAVRYQSDALDLCSRTDLEPLASLSLKVKTTDRTPPLSGEGESCLFEMDTPSGRPASLRVEAVAPETVAAAEQIYKAQRDGSRMTPDGQVSGVGEEAEGFTLQTEPGFKYSEYRIHVRDGNLVIEVWLAVGGDEFTPKETLAEKVLGITKTIFATVSEEWRAGP